MTTETPQATTTEAPAVKAEAPSFDIDALINERIAQVEESAIKTVTNKIVDSLSGKKEKPTLDPIQQAFIEQPREFVETIKKQTRDEVMAEVNKQTLLAREFSEAMTPIYDDYPELKKVPNEILAAVNQMDANEPLSKRLEKASEKVVSNLGLKKRSQADKEATMMPFGANGQSSTPPQQSVSKMLNQTGQDYIKARKAKFDALRTPNVK
jgi:hypothetical protein